MYIVLTSVPLEFIPKEGCKVSSDGGLVTELRLSFIPLFVDEFVCLGVYLKLCWPQIVVINSPSASQVLR